MLINLYGLTRTTMYNLVLHEMAHVFLLYHGIYYVLCQQVALYMQLSELKW